MTEMFWRDTTTAVANADRYTGCGVLERQDIRVCCWGRGAMYPCEDVRRYICVTLINIVDALLARNLGIVIAWALWYQFGQRCDCDLDGLALHAAFHCCAEGVLQQLSDYVLEMHRNMREGIVWLAIDVDGGTNAVLELADLAHRVRAVLDNERRLQLGVNNTDVAWVVVCIMHDFVVWLTREMQRKVLLGNQACPYPSSQMLVQEARHVFGLDVLSGFQKTSCQDADGVCVCLHQVGHDLCELDLLFQRLYLALRPW